MRGFSALSIILLFVFTIAIDFAIETQIIHHAGRRKKLWRRLYNAQSVLCIALVTMICFWRGDSSKDSLSALMWMLYVYFSIYLPKFLYLITTRIGWLIGKCVAKNKARIGHVARIAGVVIALVFFFLHLFGHIFSCL